MIQIARMEIGDETGEALAKAAHRRGQSVDDVLRSLLGVPDAGTDADGSGKAVFELVWERIRGLAGTEFATRSGQRFSYGLDGTYVAPSTSDVRIPVSQFRKAYAMGPVRGPSSLRSVFAPSLVWAILNDPRVAGEGRHPIAAATGQSGGSEPTQSDRGDLAMSGRIGGRAAGVGQTWPDDSMAEAELPMVAAQDPTPGGPSAPDTQLPQADADALAIADDLPGPTTAAFETTPAPTAGFASPQVDPEPLPEPRGIFRKLFGVRR